MKRIRFVLISLTALLVLAAAASLRRIPGGTEAVCVASDGSLHVLAAGWHVVGPGSGLLRYPAGERSYRVPRQGSIPIVFQNGDSVRVAFAFDLSFAPGSSQQIYQHFSQDFDLAFANLVVSAAEIEAGSRVSAAGGGDLVASVVERVREEMARLGVDVRHGGSAESQARAGGRP